MKHSAFMICKFQLCLESLDDAKTFEDAGIQNCVMVVATDDDIRNVNIAFRAREADPECIITSTCSQRDI